VLRDLRYLRAFVFQIASFLITEAFMTTRPATFDKSIAQWLDEQERPWGRLRYKLIQANLARHLERAGPLRVLDAGGGNGHDALWLAEQGHTVDLVDYSKQMLEVAASRAAEAGLAQQIRVCQADLLGFPDLYKAASFDVVLCHQVLQYVEDARGLCASLVAALKPGGIVSLVTMNRYSIPYHAAFLRGDLAEALAQVDARTTRAYIFDAVLMYFSTDEIIAMLTDLGCVIEGDYGIRCMCDYWGDIDRKSDPAVFEQIERLEFALTDKFPYKLLARNLQVIARKL
jgi:S-adenosylmethionine-dependent methyltransferase